MMFACLENKPETFLPSKQHALNQDNSMITLLKSKKNAERNTTKILQRWAKCRHRQDLNLRGQSPVDFKSTALTTRPRCRTLLCQTVMKLKIKMKSRMKWKWLYVLVPRFIALLVHYNLKLLVCCAAWWKERKSYDVRNNAGFLLPRCTYKYVLAGHRFLLKTAKLSWNFEKENDIFSRFRNLRWQE